MALRQGLSVGHRTQRFDVNADLPFGTDQHHGLVFAVAEVEGAVAHNVAKCRLAERPLDELQVLRRRQRVGAKQLAQRRVCGDVAASVALEGES